MTLGEHLLGRVPAPDQQHVALHAFSTTAPAAVDVEVNIKRPTLSDYNQDGPKCVGFSTSKVVNFFNKYAFDADWLYAECKKIDGDPTGDGTNARYACDVLRAQGHWRMVSGKPVKAGPQKAHGIASNTWATRVDDIRAVFSRPVPQPVLIGIDWMSAWFSPEKRGADYWLQDIAGAGGVAGGHEIAVFACSDQRQAFGLSNTWGNWPDPSRKDTLVWLPYADMEHLFALGADACIINDLATR